MNIKKELQKAFPRHKIHHEEETQSKDERYFILYDKGKKLSLYLHRDSCSVNAWSGKTLFILSVFTSAKKAIAFMRLLYAYTIWLKSSK